MVEDPKFGPVRCPACASAVAPDRPPTSGSEISRPFQYVRLGARYFRCSAHGRLSVREEDVDGVSRDVVVLHDESDPTVYYVSE